MMPSARTTTTASARSRAALRPYRAKRNFAASPEPSGETASARQGDAATRFFCVQLHLASHLHFDFRLEDAGVLRSWAVPKGVSRSPAQRRLAIQVEDHPYDYGRFSGIIPSGYGAGIVALWDQGVWQPLSDDLPAAWKRGHLKFLLLGSRLKGEWTLVRGRDASGKAWFLIKHQDQWALPARASSAPEIPTSDIVEELAQVVARQPSAPTWPGGLPATGGETGALFRQVLARAARLARPAGQRAGAAASPRRAASTPARPTPRPSPRRTRSRAGTSR